MSSLREYATLAERIGLDMWKVSQENVMIQALNRLIATIKAFLSRYDSIQAKLKEMEAQEAEAVKLIDDAITELEKRGE